jgi:Zn-dependent M16 (insulinase) family peptidase
MAFARGDADTLDSSKPLNGKSALNADSPHPLTDLQEKAIELVRQGKSYRQIGKELDTDEANIRKDPAIRAARLEVDPDAHSTTNYDSIAACRTSSADERIRSIKTDLEMLVDKHFYTLSKRDQKRLKDILEQGLEALKSYA